MAAPTRTAHRPLTLATAGDPLGTARRGAAAALALAVLAGAGGIGLAASAVVAVPWVVGMVLVIAVFAGVLLASVAWRRGFC